MVERSNKYLVVVCLLKGKKFPQKSSHNLICEARFAGEALGTDEVPLDSQPDISQELAWEVDKRALHQHKLQRSALKLQFYSQTAHTKDFLGYIMLDVRSCGSFLKQNTKWYSLLGSKCAKTVPEVQISTYVDHPQQQQPPLSPQTSSIPQQAIPKLMQPHKTHQTPLKAILNVATGCYHIGSEVNTAASKNRKNTKLNKLFPASDDKDTHQFLFSIVVAMAANLGQLVPTNSLLNESYFFYYNLLDSDITTQTFTDLLAPSFNVDKASVKFRSSVNALRDYFSQSPDLELHLCSGSEILGVCRIPISQLSSALVVSDDGLDVMESLVEKPVFIEGLFELVGLDGPTVMLPEEERPVVGVSIMLKPDSVFEEQRKMLKKKERTFNNDNKQEANDLPKIQHTFNNTEKPNIATKSDPVIINSEQNLPNIQENNLFNNQHSDPNSIGNTNTDKNNSHHMKVNDNMNNDNVTNDNTTHHYNLSIELNTIFTSPHSDDVTNIFLKYNYPLFSSTSPVTTRPSINHNTQDGCMDGNIPRSYCSFDFATSYHNILHTFKTIPLVVEVWSIDGDGVLHKFIASANINLSGVLGSSSVQADDGTTLKVNEDRAVLPTKKHLSTTVPVISQQNIELGSLEMFLTLEDWGAVPGQQQNIQQQRPQQIIQHPSQKNLQPPQQQTSYNPPQQPHYQYVAPQTSQHTQPPQTNLQQQPFNNIPYQNANNNVIDKNQAINNNGQMNGAINLSGNIRDTTEYKTAMQLEVWKSEQMKLFEKKMSEKEKQIEERLEREFKKRERERVVLINKQRVEYERLKEELRKSLDMLEGREKMLASNEADLQSRQKEQERELQRRSEELKEASKRMQDHCSHQVNLQRNKALAAEEAASNLKEKMTEMETKHQRLMKQLEQLREKHFDTHLQSENARLTIEKENYRKQAEETTKSKENYKLQWAKALKIIAKYKERDLQLAIQTQKKQEEELDRWKAKGKLESELEEVRKERGDLQRMVQGLQELQQNYKENENIPKLNNVKNDFEGISDNDNFSTMSHARRKKVLRLQEEKDLLMKTGVYNAEDELIVNIDKKIEQMMASFNN